MASPSSVKAVLRWYIHHRKHCPQPLHRDALCTTQAAEPDPHPRKARNDPMTVPQAGRLVKPQESDQTWPNGGRSGMTPGTSVRLFSTAANDPVSLRGLISAVLA